VSVRDRIERSQPLMEAGTFTFMNGTSSTSATQVICYRNPAYTHWWYITLPAWTLFFMVPILAFGLGIWFRADYRSRDMAVMVIVASAGYCVYYFVKQVRFEQLGAGRESDCSISNSRIRRISCLPWELLRLGELSHSSLFARLTPPVACWATFIRDCLEDLVSPVMKQSIDRH
jgi:hypothetical protein